MSGSSAAHLRARAVRLRLFARRLESADLMDVRRDGGPDTWVGPSQQHWDDDLRRRCGALAQAAEQARAAARRLERQADDIERFAVPAPTGPQ